jgi:hypothetical protein
MRSRKPQAKAFKKWVTKEVLPALRSTGEYVTDKAAYQKRLEDAKYHRELMDRMLHITERTINIIDRLDAQMDNIFNAAMDKLKGHEAKLRGDRVPAQEYKVPDGYISLSKYVENGRSRLSYEVLKFFVAEYSLPLETAVYYDHVKQIEAVSEVYEIKALRKLEKKVIKKAKPVSKHYYKHKRYLKKFKIKGKK